MLHASDRIFVVGIVGWSPIDWCLFVCRRPVPLQEGPCWLSYYIIKPGEYATKPLHSSVKQMVSQRVRPVRNKVCTYHQSFIIACNVSLHCTTLQFNWSARMGWLDFQPIKPTRWNTNVAFHPCPQLNLVLVSLLNYFSSVVDVCIDFLNYFSSVVDVCIDFLCLDFGV